MDANSNNPMANPYAMFYGMQMQQQQQQQALQQQPHDPSQPQPPQQNEPSQGNVDQGQQPAATANNNNSSAASAQDAAPAPSQDPNSISNNNFAAAFQGYPLLMQQYLMQQAQQQQQMMAAAAGGFFMPQAANGGMQQPSFMNWGAMAAAGGDPNLTAALAMPGMGGGAADAYADQGFLGPWSANSAGLLGRMGPGMVVPLETAKGIKRLRKKPKDRPKRPLSSYNAFFREERQRILSKIPDKEEKASGGGAVVKVETEEKDEESDDVKADSKEEDAVKKGEEEEDTGGDDAAANGGKEAVDATVGDESEEATNKKRPHGKIGFESLAKVIGRRWQELTPDQVAYYKAIADKDMIRYKAEMEIYLGRRVDGEGGAPAAAAANYNEILGETEAVNGNAAEEGSDEPPEKKQKAETSDDCLV